MCRLGSAAVFCVIGGGDGVGGGGGG